MPDGRGARVCPSCGGENPDGFSHCGSCGSPLPTSVHERRKLTTMLFCDMTGSTPLGERVDAETLRGLMLAYFQEMRTALERHGGTVEKFIGDAVLAAFGVPAAHEDDALRACRAALEMQSRMAVLNEELERRFGERIALRIGLYTGQVVTGDPTSRESFVTGDAVNVAARLEQAAAPGEVLIGEPTYGLVRGAVTVEPVEPLALKGKSQPLPAYRLLDVIGSGRVPRRLASPLVGRESELAALDEELDAALATHACRLVTVVGDAGVGKTRLATELIGRAGIRVRVLRGRCLSYGEGITYWPIGEIVREAAGILDEHSQAEAHARIDALTEHLLNGNAISARIAQLVGLAEGVGTAQETAWAIRRFLAALADDRPLLVVVDDIHWAEPALLELLAGLPTMIADAPILILGLARPELLEAQPEWQATIQLGPLRASEVESLIQALVAAPPAGFAALLSQTSAGNPLYLEELVAMLVDEGVLRGDADGPWALHREPGDIALPASLSSLLGARLDRLDESGRAALERGAIEGELFHRGAVVELTDPASRAGLPAQLESLVDKQLVFPAPASFVGEEAFRFRHILVREAAYQTTAKKLRASLHEQFADWLERYTGARVAEYEEILGYHLEQSYRYRIELRPLDEETSSLGRRAAARLGGAGRRAIGRGDIRAAINLLRRAAALVPPESSERIELLPYLVDALLEAAQIEEAEALVEEMAEAVEPLGDERLSALVSVHRASVKLGIDPRGWLNRALADAAHAITVFEPLGDDGGLTWAWEVVFRVHWLHCHTSDATAAAEHGLYHAERAGDTRKQGNHRLSRLAAAHAGLATVDDIEAMNRADLAWAQKTGSLWVEAITYHARGLVEGVRGHPVEAKELHDHGTSILVDLGMELFAVGATGSWIWWLTDDPVAAEAQLRTSRDMLSRAGLVGALTSIDLNLAEALYRQGRYDEAEEMADEAAEVAAEDDINPQAYVRAIRSKILARRGLTDEAEALARAGVALADETDWVDLRGDSLLALGEVLQLAGRDGEAVEPIRQALELWEAKGSVRFAARASRLLSAVTAPA